MATVNLLTSEKYVEEHRGAAFRRTNIEGIVLCDVCYSLVSYEHTYYHSDWHEELAIQGGLNAGYHVRA